MRPVHRLDEPVTGVVVLARHRDAALKFQQAMAAGNVSKTYGAILEEHPHGRAPPALGERSVYISPAMFNRPAPRLCATEQVGSDSRARAQVGKPPGSTQKRMVFACHINNTVPFAFVPDPQYLEDGNDHLGCCCPIAVPTERPSANPRGGHVPPGDWTHTPDSGHPGV